MDAYYSMTRPKSCSMGGKESCFMNGFDKETIETVIKMSENKQDEEIQHDIYGVIYSLGRDAENSEEFQYAYDKLLKLCKHANPHVRANSILSLSMLAGSGILEKETVVPIITEEWKKNREYRGTIEDAVNDLNDWLKWGIKLEKDSSG